MLPNKTNGRFGRESASAPATMPDPVAGTTSASTNKLLKNALSVSATISNTSPKFSAFWATRDVNRV